MSIAPVRISVIVPFHRNLAQLRQCLGALRAAGQRLAPTSDLHEIIVIGDAPSEDPLDVVREANAILLLIDGPQGPAVARNRGASRATGNLLVFVDADVVVHRDALLGLARLRDDEGVGAMFGSYDEQPDDPGFVSQCRNLAHSFIHRGSPGEAQTFWCGLGAVRSEVFRSVHGFDERFRRPSVEDIDLGYRIRAAGWRILLDPGVEGKHLKRWTLGSSFISDIRDRGVPWTQLLHRYGGLHNDLNLAVKYRVSIALAYLLAMSLILAWWWPVTLVVSAASVLELWYLDRAYYGYFARRRGAVFLLGWFPLHALHHLCNGLSFVIGTLLYVCQRWCGLSLPGALPVTPWQPAPHSS